MATSPSDPKRTTTTTTVAGPNGRPYYTMRNPQAVAWGLTLTGFFVFCMICIATTAAARWFLFDSHVDLNVRVEVSRGRVDMQLADGITSTGVTLRESVSPGTTLTADSVSQGYLTFEDFYSKQTIATVFLLQESQATLLQGSRPRFDWSNTAYIITLDDASGRFYIEIPGTSRRQLLLYLQSGVGKVLFSGTGVFRVEVGASTLQLYAESGNAILRPDSGQPILVSAGRVGTISSGQTSVQDSPFEVRNSGFGLTSDVDTNPVPPGGWACGGYANRQEESIGKFTRSVVDNQVVMRLQRVGSLLDHAETRCQFQFAPVPVPVGDTPPNTGVNSANGQDIRNYSWLSIRAKIRIRSQDVTTCGVQGSECPIMLQLEYIGAGQAQFWRHGFYTLRPVNDGNPVSCDTCLQEHDKLNPDTWYIYDSGNLLKTLVGAKRPEYISQIDFYASGHAYDAIIGNISVIVSK